MLVCALKIGSVYFSGFALTVRFREVTSVPRRGVRAVGDVAGLGGQDRRILLKIRRLLGVFGGLGGVALIVVWLALLEWPDGPG